MKSYHRGTIIGTLIGGTFGLALAIGAVALASPGGPHGKQWDPERMEQRVNEMIERLDLSPAQEGQVRTVMADARTQLEAIREMPRGQEKFEAARDLRFATEDQIYANLSCEQREELRLLTREHRAEHMQRKFEQHQARESN